MRTIRSSVSRLPTAVACLVITVFLTTFAAAFRAAAGRTLFARRFLACSAHFLEMSRLAPFAALLIAQTTLPLVMSSFAETSTR